MKSLKTKYLATLIAFFGLCGLYKQGFSQIHPSQDVTGRSNENNIITTAATFLSIAPDSRSGALGDAGAATSPDIYSQHWNASKYIFCENNSGVGLSYTPWLKNFINDMKLVYLSGFKKIKETQAVGYSITYFNLGDMEFTDENGSLLKSYTPKEFAIDASYSMKLGNNLSGAITMRYIYSNLTGGIGGDNIHAGHAIAGDVSFYYLKDLELGERTAQLSLGACVSNIGSKMRYSSVADNFLPTNLRLGAGFKFDFDQFNSITLTGDVNKLLIPTPPIYNATGDSIIAGKDPNVSVPTGIFRSFSDAPDGMSEELKELYYSLGLEYVYNNTLAGRFGYFSEHKDKGGRKYMTFGVGISIKIFKFDLAYLVPTTANSPLQNTIRFSVGICLDKMEK